MDMKCYDVVTRENIVLEYNMQEMCNWKWCNIVEMYSMIVGYVFTFVDLRFTIVEYNFTLVKYILILVEYKLILIEIKISFRRI